MQGNKLALAILIFLKKDKTDVKVTYGGRDLFKSRQFLENERGNT